MEQNLAVSVYSFYQTQSYFFNDQVNQINEKVGFIMVF